MGDVRGGGMWVRRHVGASHVGRRHVGASACGRGGMWARRLFAPLEQHAPGRPVYVLSRSLRLVLRTLMVAAVTAVVTLAMTLVG